MALFATANTALIAMMAASRLLFAMARGGDAPPLLARTLARRQTPAAAVLLVVAGALVCLPLGGVGLVGASRRCWRSSPSPRSMPRWCACASPTRRRRPFACRCRSAGARAALLGLVVVVLLLTRVRATGLRHRGGRPGPRVRRASHPVEAGSRARRIATMKPGGTRPRREPRSTSQPVTVTPIDVVFISGGVTCAADLYRPDGPAGSLPCLVMGHGFSGTKGLARVYAERFAAAGLAVLVFDYRHFGASGGQPRQIVDVVRQREDYHAAVRWTRSCPGIDPERIALWGTSFSGGHVIAVAAEDPRIAAVVAQVPLLDARRTGRTTRQRLRRALSRSVLKLFVAATRDAMRAVRGLPPYLARVVGRPGEAAVYTDPQVAAIFAELGGEAGWLAQRVCPALLVRLAAVSPRHGGAAADAALGVRRRSRSRGLTVLRPHGLLRRLPVVEVRHYPSAISTCM